MCNCNILAAGANNPIFWWLCKECEFLRPRRRVSAPRLYGKVRLPSIPDFVSRDVPDAMD